MKLAISVNSSLLAQLHVGTPDSLFQLLCHKKNFYEISISKHMQFQLVRERWFIMECTCSFDISFANFFRIVLNNSINNNGMRHSFVCTVLFSSVNRKGPSFLFVIWKFTNDITISDVLSAWSFFCVCINRKQTNWEFYSAAEQTELKWLARFYFSQL